MSFEDVLSRGEDFLREYPRTSPFWNVASHATCFGMIAGSKFLLNLLYKPHVHNIENLDNALAKAREQNRGLITVMNHMSVVDDPTFYAALPWRYHFDIDTIRWSFGADNICFSNKAYSWFFNLGKVLGTKRFGDGPFQSSLDAAIRVLSPDDTLDLELAPDYGKKKPRSVILQELNNRESKPLANDLQKGSNVLMSKSPFVRTKTSWFHVFPEGFVLQLEPPHNNSMRYFKWGVSRLILESTRTPIVVPIFSYGFEKIAPEDTAEEGIKRYLPNNMGAEVHIHIGEEIDSKIIENYRDKWRQYVTKYQDPKNPNDLSPELKEGKKVQALRSDVAAMLRDAVLKIRNGLPQFSPEDPRFKDPGFWKKFAQTEGESAPDVKFIGKNWAIRRFQKHLPEFDDHE